MTSSSDKDTQTPRVIDGPGAFAIVAGSMIGIGIFLSPPIVAAHISNVWLFLAMWLFGGLTALAGAVACAELGAMMPRAGGDYVFQYEAFGPSIAFASGWILFGAIFSGSIAAMSVGLCTYQLPVLLGTDLSVPALSLAGWTVSRAEVAALMLVPLLTWLNALGARPSARTQMLLTALPIGVLLIFALYAIMTGGAGAQAAQTTRQPTTIDGLAVAYMAVYFAYSGWINIVYVAGEVEKPQRNIPFALIGGTLVITALYLLLCAGFIRVLGMGALPDAGEAGSAMATVLAGQPGRVVVTVLIASALLASINATVLGGARVAYAMGQRGAGWSGLGSIESESGVPRKALWLQAVLSCLLILSGRFEQLFTMVSLTMVVTGSLTVASLFVLRARQPDAERPYRASGYPWLPGLYIVSSILAAAVMLVRALSGTEGAWYPLLGVVAFVAMFLAHRTVAAGKID